jgi:hypothetical protein
MRVDDLPFQHMTSSIGQLQELTGVHPEHLDNMPGIVLIQHDFLLLSGIR